ncbi:AI-2E family transporter [Candidatus Daviesbacteria bacterium]|nr:AI-2E family transporter [Candidatus Daviesbacteria bacterium]
MTRKIDISHKTIFFIAGFIGALWIIYLIKDVILLLFVAIILMSALSPFVEKLMHWKFPKGLAIGLIYLAIILIIGLLLYVIVTPLIEQTSSLTTSLPHTIEKLMPDGTFNRNLLEQKLTDIFGNALGVTLTIFSNAITIVSIAVLTFYLLLDKERFENLLSHAFVSNQSRAKKLITRFEDMLGAWLRGQVVLSLVIGIMSYILLYIFKIPYALPLAILAGIMEVVPVIGPIVSAIPPILIAYVTSPSPALPLFIAIGYLAIQQLESHIIVPQVMKRAVGLNPLVVILAIAIGGRVLGISGALLAVPITVVVQILLEEILDTKESII